MRWLDGIELLGHCLTVFNARIGIHNFNACKSTSGDDGFLGRSDITIYSKEEKGLVRSDINEY
jgi:hypothetical protein